MRFTKLLYTSSMLIFVLNPFCQPIQKFKDENGKYGFKNDEGSVITPPKYDWVSTYENGLVMVKSGDKYGCVNKNGLEIIPVKYTSVYSLKGTNNYYLVELNDKTGIVDSSNNEIVPIKYNSISSSVNSGLMEVWLNGKRGFIDINGKEIIPVIYDYTYPIVIYGNLVSVIVEKDSKYGLVDSKNNVLMGFDYKWIAPEYNSLKVKLNEKFGLYTYTGELILNIIYDKIETDMLTERIIACMNGKYMLLDYTGKKLTDAKYDGMEKRTYGSREDKPVEGLFSVCVVNGDLRKYGFINQNGEEITEIKYDYCYNYEYGYAPVVLNNKFGLVDFNGTEIIKPDTYDWTRSFSEGLAAVNIGGTWNDKTEPDFEGGKWGFIDTNGVVIIPIQYDAVSAFYKGSSKVKLNGREFYIDKSGNEVSR